MKKRFFNIQFFADDDLETLKCKNKALEDEIKQLKQEKQDLETKNADLVKSGDELRLMNGKLMLQVEKQVTSDEEDDKKDENLSFEEKLMNIYNKE